MFLIQLSWSIQTVAPSHAPGRRGQAFGECGEDGAHGGAGTAQWLVGWVLG